MSRRDRDRPGCLAAIVWWLLLLGWTAFIWSRSLQTGAASDAESYEVVGMLQKLAAWFALQDIPLVNQLLAEHPGIISRLADPGLLNHYVRKAAHAGEFFVLGVLAWNALRASLRNPFGFCLLLGLIWAGVPYIDESIQRHVPNRAGQLSDVLLDMTGFGVAVVLGALFAGIAALIRGPRDE